MSNWKNFFKIRYKIIRNYFSTLHSEAVIRISIYFLLILMFWVGSYFFFRHTFSFLQHRAPLVGPIIVNRLTAIILMALTLILLFSNAFSAYSVLYASKDMPLLLSSCTSPQQIFYWKLADIFFQGSWAGLSFSFPLFFAYGKSMNAPKLYYFSFTFGLIPLVLLSGGLGIILMLILARTIFGRTIRIPPWIWLTTVPLIIWVSFRALPTARLIRRIPMTTIDHYLFNLRGTFFPYAPHTWMKNILSFSLNSEYREVGFYWLLLISSAMLILFLIHLLGEKIFFAGWLRAADNSSIFSWQKAKPKTYSQLGTRKKWFQPVGPLAPYYALLRKDLKTFWRDPSQWAQFFILIGLVVSYIYQTSHAYIRHGQIFWVNILGFVNMGVTGFITATLAIRFAFPSISLEGKPFWNIASSPISRRNFFWYKFFFNLSWISLIGISLIMVSHYTLPLSAFINNLSFITVILWCLGFTSLTVGIGAIFPRFYAANIVEIASGFGAMASIVLCLGYLAFTICILAYPLHSYFHEGFSLYSISLKYWLFTGLMYLCLNLTAILLPLKLGLKKLEKEEL